MMTSKKKIGALRDRYHQHQYYQHQQMQQQQQQQPPPAPVAADPDIENSHVRGADGSFLVIHRVPLAVESGFPCLQSPPIHPHHSDDSNTISDHSDKQDDPIRPKSMNSATMTATGESRSPSTTPKQNIESIANEDDEEHQGYDGAFPLTNPVDDVIHLYEKFGQSLAILLLRSRLQISSLQTERQDNKQLKAQNEQLLCQVTGVRGELKTLTEIYEQAVINEKKQTEDFRQEMIKWKNHYFDLNAELESTKRDSLEKQLIIEELEKKLENISGCQGNCKESKEEQRARELEEDTRINLHKKEIERLNLLNYEQSRLLNKLETQKKADLHLQFQTGAKLNELEAANLKWQKEFAAVQENCEKLKEEKVKLEKESKFLAVKSKKLKIRMKNRYVKLRKDLLVGKTCWKIKTTLKNKERVKLQMEKGEKKRKQVKKLKRKNKNLRCKLEVILKEQAEQYRKPTLLNQLLHEKFNHDDDNDNGPQTQLVDNEVLDTATLSPEAVVAQQHNPEPSTSPGIMEDDNVFAEKFKILINLDNGQPEKIVPSSSIVATETNQMVSSIESTNANTSCNAVSVDADAGGQEDEDVINKLKISQVTSLSFADLCDDDIEEEEENDDVSSTSSFTESEKGLDCGTSVICFNKNGETIKQKLF